MAPQAVKQASDAISFNRNRRLVNGVLRKAGRQLAQRQISLRHAVEDLGHADKTIADKADSRIDRSSISFATIDRFACDHPIGHVRFSDSAEFQLKAVLLADVSGHSAG